MRALVLMLLALAPLTAGCGNFGYYVQSIDGQLSVLHARQPVAQLLADPATPPVLKSRLERALTIRDFASRELLLPDNKSYRSYADLKRPFVVWNVFATAEFSVTPEQWCFLFAGCVGYRGYFAQANADAFAQDLREKGLDVYVGGVPAYSTLGWFDDPLLNTFVNYPEYELARLIFHELAHQLVYVKGDSEFNESFAAAVEDEGVKRWIARGNDGKMRAEYELAQQRRAQFAALVLKYRGALEALYRSALAPAAMRERKAEVFAQLAQDYQRLKTEWGGFAGYDRFFVEPGNASLASVALYTALVPRFLQLLASHRGDLNAFYAEVKEIAALGADARASRLGVAAAAK